MSDTIHNTLKSVKDILKGEDIEKKIVKLQDEVLNYDELLIIEINKRVEGLKRMDKEVDYEFIIKSIHKRYKKKLSLYLHIVYLFMKSECELNEE